MVSEGTGGRAVLMDSPYIRYFFYFFFSRWIDLNDGLSMLCHKAIFIIGFYLIRLFIEQMKFNLFDKGWYIVYIYTGPLAPE